MTCSLFEALVSRGDTNVAKCNTSNLVTHLMSPNMKKHEFTRVKKKCAANLRVTVQK